MKVYNNSPRMLLEAEPQSWLSPSKSPLNFLEVGVAKHKYRDQKVGVSVLVVDKQIGVWREMSVCRVVLWIRKDVNVIISSIILGCRKIISS